MKPSSSSAIATKSRRELLYAASGAAAAIGLPASVEAKAPERHKHQEAKKSMTTIMTRDGTKLFYKDWGTGQPLVFSHGWPLTADAWDSQMLFLAERGYRVIAHDRRGHGRSDQTWSGNDMNTYADDLAEIIEALSLRDAVLIGHSTGGGEVARYIGRHGTGRLAKAVLIASVPPLMLKTDSNPGGLPLSVFDGLRAQLVADRSQFFKGLAMPFFGFNKPGAKVSQGAIDSFWRQGMLGSIKGQYDCIKQFSETDFTSDLRKFDIPTLVMQGDADQIVPIADASLLSVKLVKTGTLKVIPEGAHGMCTTSADVVNDELLAFIKA